MFRIVLIALSLSLAGCATADPCYGPWGTEGLQDFGCPDRPPPNDGNPN